MAEELYGATVEDVRALLPHRRIDATTRPSAEQVEGFLAFTTAEVGARIDVLTIAGASPAVIARAEGAARGYVAMGAAAMAEDAGHPEQAGRGASSYGGVLWERYTERLEGIVGFLDLDEGDAGGPGVGSSSDLPAHSFPEPRMRATTGF